MRRRRRRWEVKLAELRQCMSECNALLSCVEGSGIRRGVCRGCARPRWRVWRMEGMEGNVGNVRDAWKGMRGNRKGTSCTALGTKRVWDARDALKQQDWSGVDCSVMCCMMSEHEGHALQRDGDCAGHGMQYDVRCAATGSECVPTDNVSRKWCLSQSPDD